MKLTTDEWEIAIVGLKFRAKHLGCSKGVTMFNTDGHPSLTIMDHDEDSHCVCGCRSTSPKLKEFDIITESTQEC